MHEFVFNTYVTIILNRFLSNTLKECKKKEVNKFYNCNINIYIVFDCLHNAQKQNGVSI